MKENIFIELLFFSENISVDLSVPYDIHIKDLVNKVSMSIGSETDANHLKVFLENEKRWLSGDLSLSEEGVGDGNLLVVKAVSDS